jgi:hypothetical protein
MLNQRMDLAQAQRAFRDRGRIQIRDFLQAGAADALLQCLAHEVPWTLAIRREGLDVRRLYGLMILRRRTLHVTGPMMCRSPRKRSR